MCGIFGTTRFREEELETARESLHTLSHRGPDQWGDYFDEQVYIGHRRLSILDLSDQGRQPMVCEGEDVVISVNGEIYNFREIRKELQSTYRFVSRSDSEVVLHGYREWGIKGLLDRIDGMFAFSIYDKRNRELYLVRDRMGIKPLYYARKEGAVVWASELKAIQRFYGSKHPDYDYTALYDFLTYRYIPSPKSMYRDVFKLQPGHYLKIDLASDSIRDVRYWELEIGDNGDSIETAGERIVELVKKSVDEQMVSDVPVGFFLSGGMDSSTLVAIASRLNSQISTFSIGFSDKSHDETRFADLVAKKYRTAHHKKILDSDRTEGMFTKIKQWYDEPFADTSCFPTYLVSEYAKENVTVALTGDGGDEIFGGYAWYEKFRMHTRVNMPALSFLRPMLNPFKGRTKYLDILLGKIEKPYLLDEMEIYTWLMSGMLKEHKKSYREAWEITDDYDDYWYFREHYRRDLDWMTRLQYMDFHTFLHDDILTKVDRVSMAVSLECRVPLLARELVEYMFSLPVGVRYYRGNLKGAMKEAFRNELPGEILNRDKKGFGIPLNWNNSILGEGWNRQEYILREVFGINEDK